MTTATADLDRAVPGQGLQERPEADLVPGLRRLRRGAGHLPRAGRRRPPAARDRVRLGHRLLEPHSRLHDRLRLQQRARPRAADRAGHQARQPRPAGARRRRRRRRVLDRRRPRGARHPPQHRPDLHRDGQPDLRADQGAAVADLAARAEHRVLVATAAWRTRSTRCSTCSATARASSRRARRPTWRGLAAIIEEGIRFPGFAFINVQSPCVTYGAGGAAAQGAEGDDAAARSRWATTRPTGSKAMELAQDYGTKLYTGVFYRNPEPPPTYEAEAPARQQETRPQARPRHQILEMFRAQ